MLVVPRTNCETNIYEDQYMTLVSKYIEVSTIAILNINEFYSCTLNFNHDFIL